MAEIRRTVAAESPSRRTIRGAGAAIPPDAQRLLARMADGHAGLWRALARSLGLDQPAAERFVWQIVDAGLAEVEQARDRKGDWQSVRWRLTPEGVAQFQPDPKDGHLADEMAVFVEQFEYGTAAVRNHPVLQQIVAWFGREGQTASQRTQRVVLAVARELTLGRQPMERVLAVELFGNSKALRLADLREDLTRAFGRPAEHVLRRHAGAVRTYGRFSFTISGERIGGMWSRPWLGLTEATVGAMTDLTVDGDTLVTIENLTCFERYVDEGCPDGQVVLWTGGFLGEVETRWLQRLLEAGIRHVRHWGDLDPDGLAILRQIESVAAIPAAPLRMMPELLETALVRELTDRDREALLRQASGGGAVAELAVAILARGGKVEQEAWYVAK